MSNKVKRLFQSFQPDSYQVKLRLDSDNNKFSGSVSIDGRRVGRPSKRITLHQNELRILSAKVISHQKDGDQQLKVVRLNKQDSFDEIRLHFDDLLYPGAYSLSLEFEGPITTKMNGIYPCFFEDQGVKKKLIATQFESHYARQAFPCIDEPEAKATFTLSLNTPIVSTVISNTEVFNQTTDGDRLNTIFATTPRMSTYLLAFVAGDMDYKQAKSKNGTTIRTYATSANIEFTQFALDCAVKTLDFYNDYFDIAYPLAKCDFVALPDFSSGAMENWGCITFREQAMLVDPKHTSLSLKQYIANVIAHELTHQWFGNLVTMRWWTDLWLNESFASWMSYLAVDHLFPDWQVWTQFIVDEQGLALKQDALEFTHPIEVKVNHPDEIRTIFDVISYEKGASILTMLQDYLGAERFQKGVQMYLKSHSYGNTDTVDLWQALETASGMEVKALMAKWTSLSGYPIVKANYSDASLSLQQERFYLNPMSKKSESVWPIPLLTDHQLGKFDPFTHSSSVIQLTADQSPFLLNQGRKGFYRVIYDSRMMADLLADGGLELLGDADRLGLLSDSIEAAKAGYASTSETLDLLSYYANESSVVVWEVISSLLGNIRLVMNDDDLRQQMKPFIIGFTSKQLARLGWLETDKDSHFDKLLRPIILGLAAVAEEPSVIAEVKRQFYEVGDVSLIEPDLRAVVYSTIARLGGEKDFNLLYDMHRQTNSSEEKLNLCAALTNFKQPELIDRALKAISSSDVRLQDVAYWLSYIFINHYARPQAWQWVVDNWQWLEQNLGSDLSFSRLPNYIARCYSDLDFLTDFRAFFDKNLDRSLELSYKQAIETIVWQSEWRLRDSNNIIQFFSK